MIKAIAKSFSKIICFCFLLECLMKFYRMINLNDCFILFVFNLVNGWSTTHLDHLLPKSLRYKDRKENYIQSLIEGIISHGLQLNRNQHLNQFLVNLMIKWITERNWNGNWKKKNKIRSVQMIILRKENIRLIQF